MTHRFRGVEGEQTTTKAKTEADPYGMTTKRTTARAAATAKVAATAHGLHR
jgi:hypothetical protein